MKNQTHEYNKGTGQIIICDYNDGLDIGDEVVITKKKSLGDITKFEV